MRFIYNKTTTVMITVFLFFSYSMVVANENKFPPIMFKKGEVQFNINTPVIAGDKTQFSVESMSTEKMATKRHMIMQFQKLPTDSDKRKLAKNGIKLLSYIPKNAYWVSIETRGVQYARSNLVNSDGESGHVLWSPPSHYKLSKSVEERNFSTFSLDGDKVKLLLSFYKDVSQQEAESALNKGVQVTTVIWKDKHLAEISINKKLIDALAKIDVVKGMEVVQKNSVDNVTSAQRIGVDIIKGNPLNLDGTGVSVGVWDGGRVGVHQDLTGRVTDITSSGTSVSNHATHVTGTIIGRGLGNTSAEGMAIGATVLNGYYNDSYLGQFRAASADNSIQLSNWSFGYDVGWSIDGTTHQPNDFLFGSYRAEAATVDDIIADEGALLFKAAGNDRDDCNVNNSADCDGDGDGYDTISGNGNAKNIITVGATTDADTMSSFSGWGPTDDHRVKPDLCANGVGVYSTLPNHNYGSMNGTSMASPSAAGAGTLLYQHYKAVYGGFPSDAAIIKGVMIHTASDFATVGPDAQCGWGLINAKKAADVISDQHIKTDSISQSGTEKTIQINVP